jgi:hypothetical protein
VTDEHCSSEARSSSVLLALFVLCLVLCPCSTAGSRLDGGSSWGIYVCCANCQIGDRRHYASDAMAHSLMLAHACRLYSTATSCIPPAGRDRDGVTCACRPGSRRRYVRVLHGACSSWDLRSMHTIVGGSVKCVLRACHAIHVVRFFQIRRILAKRQAYICVLDCPQAYICVYPWIKRVK